MSDETPAIEITPENYPSIDLVYPLAIESYETARQRMIAQDNRIHQLLTLTLALTAAVPAVYQIFGINPRLTYLIAAGAFFIASIGLLIAAFMRNTLIASDISKLHAYYINVPEITAKENFIYYAGIHDRENARQMEIRWRLIIASICALAAELVALVLSALCHLS
jgi:hypothetical protein